jgi:hypothetical protein
VGNKIGVEIAFLPIVPTKTLAIYSYPLEEISPENEVHILFVDQVCKEDFDLI